MALLQIEQMVEPKYLNPPLGTQIQKLSYQHFSSLLSAVNVAQ